MATAYNGTIETGGAALEYDERGPDDGEVILLIMGIGAQLTAWREGFCNQLADEGYRVVRFDNRDAGLSSRTPGPAPTMVELAALLKPGTKRRPVPYTFSDMAGDAMAVLDAVGVRQAHIVGASLGGMIAQTVAIEHRERVLSLTSIMSKPGALTVGLPTLRVLANTVRNRPAPPDDAIEFELTRAKMIAGPLFDPEAMRGYIGESIDRASHPNGILFQAAAMFDSGDRTPGLRKLDVPTVVIHGRADPLVKLSGGEATAKAIPGAKLVVFNDMGHDLPVPLWPAITGEIAAHARHASRHRATARR